MRWIIVLIALCAVAQADDRSKAQGDATSVEARARYERGTQRYQLNDYRGALTEFERAYHLKADAALLFDAAQCHRQLGQFQEAAQRYREFLRKADDLDPTQRKQIQQLIDALSPEARPSPEPLIADLIVQQPVIAPLAPANKPPLYTRWWLWTSVGAVAIVGVGLGLGLGLHHSTVQPAAMTTFHF